MPGTAPDPSAEGGRNAARVRVTGRRFLVFMAAMLPLTAFLLWMLTFVEIWEREWDILGLIAVSIGIIGILIFYMFLYKYEMNVPLTRSGRWMMLGTHALITIALFFGMIWLGLDSPWSGELIWGTYDLHTASKPWIISVLVIGTLTGLGVLFDMLGEKFFR
jgi:hypothetical protein